MVAVGRHSLAGSVPVSGGGYERLEPWPEEFEGHGDILHAARQLWVLTNEDAIHPPFINRLAERFRLIVAG